MNHKHIKFWLFVIVICTSVLLYFHFLDGTYIYPVVNSLSARTYQTTKQIYNVDEDVLVTGSGFCKLRDVPATVYWSLQDDVSIPYPPKSTFFPKGCYGKDKIIEVGILPGFIGNHEYHFVGKVVYHLTARDISVNLSTNNFFVNGEFIKKK